MTKIKRCHIERSQNAFENEIPNVFDLLCKLTSFKIYFELINAQTDNKHSTIFSHVLSENYQRNP